MDASSIISLVDLLSWGGGALVLTILGWILIERFMSRRQQRGASGDMAYSSLVDALSDGVLIYGEDGTVRACNPAAGAIMDRDPKDLIGVGAIVPGWKVEDELGRELHEEDHPITQVIRARKNEVRNIMRVESPEGRSRWIRSSVTTLPASRAFGKVAAVAKIRDITAERDEVQALKEAEQTFRNLFEQSPNGVSITRAEDGLILEANAAWCRLFGWTRDEVVGQTLFDLGIWMKVEDRQSLLESISQGQVVQAWPFTTSHRDGSRIHASLGLAALSLNGEDCLLASLQDQSEHHQAVRDQRKVEKAESLGLMAAGISHDFNNLFQSLLTSLELAHPRTDQAGRRFLDRAMTSLERASHASRRLMEFSGGCFTNPEDLSVNALIQDVAAMPSHAGHASLEVNLAVSLPVVRADRKQLRRVLEVLVENAVEAMGNGRGTVILSSEQVSSLSAEERKQGHWVVGASAGPLVRVSVRDSAGGVDRNLIEQVFDPYVSTKAPGRGLGLPAAMGLLRGNRAGLQMVNAPGEGLTVHIYLPVGSTA